MNLMKKIVVLLLAVCLMLCACKKDPEPTTEPTTEATTEVTTEATTEATEPAVVYRNPLTGEVLDAPFTGRPFAVSIGNTTSALPQHGISKADILCEVEAEGGIPRFLAIFTEQEDVGAIGPVRSARTFFNSLAASYSAPLFHCGGSVRGIRGYHDLAGSKIADWAHVDQMSNSSYYYRDSSRSAQGYAYEHTLFTSGDNAAKALTNKGYLTGEEMDLGFRFDEAVDLEGTSAKEITVSFLGDKITDFTYDEATGVYSARQYNRDLIDGTTGEQLTFKNVIVLYTGQQKQDDGYYYRSYYDLIGSGEGYFAVNGEIVKIQWSREAVETPFVFTLEDGTPLTMGVGTTYLAVASTSSTPVAYE